MKDDFADHRDVVIPVAAAAGLLGLALAFYGYRLFKPTLFIASTTFVGLIAYMYGVAHIHTEWYYIAIGSAAMGLVVGFLSICIFRVGLFLSGAALGFLLAVVVLATIRSQDHDFYASDLTIAARSLIVFGSSIVFGAVALFLEKALLVVATAVGGAFVVVAAVDVVAFPHANQHALFYRLCYDTMIGHSKTPMSSEANEQYYGELGGWAFLALVAVLVQYGITSRRYEPAHRRHGNVEYQRLNDSPPDDFW